MNVHNYEHIKGIKIKKYTQKGTKNRWRNTWMKRSNNYKRQWANKQKKAETFTKVWKESVKVWIFWLLYEWVVIIGPGWIWFLKISS